LSKFAKIFNVNDDRKIYGNWEVYSPDDILMFRCDLKKANWYLKRHLATEIEVGKIKLNFTPKGLGNHQKPFGLSLMKNVCVVCGTEKFLTRHHVVPISYRKYFPLEIKSHNFHDVLSMCVDCHDSYERKADLLKIELAKKYEVPIWGKTIDRKEMIKWSKIATTIIGGCSHIPKSRVTQMKLELKSHFGFKRLSKKRLLSLSTIKVKEVVKTHGQMVVENIEDLQEFVTMWRRHFLENNTPKYLPKNWSPENKI